MSSKYITKLYKARQNIQESNLILNLNEICDFFSEIEFPSQVVQATKSIKKIVSIWRRKFSCAWLWNRHLYQNFPFAQSFRRRLFTLIGLLFSLSSSLHIFVSSRYTFLCCWRFWKSHKNFYLLFCNEILSHDWELLFPCYWPDSLTGKSTRLTLL